MSEAAKTPPLSTFVKMLYGLGSVAYGIKDIAFRTYLLIYYNQIIGAPAALVSAAIMTALVVDAISDPIVGQFSDNLKTRWGRRHPLMYASAIPAAASFLMLWMPPQGLSNTALFIYLVAVSSLVRTFITFYEIPSSALAPELTSHYDERTTIASYRYFFAYVGGLGMSFMALYVFLRPTEQYPVGQLNPEGYLTFGLVGAIIMFCSVLISSVGTHHRIPFLKKPIAKPLGFRATLRHMKESFSERSFLSILGFGVLKYTAIGMTAALTLYFGTFFWELGSKQLALLALDGVLGACIAFVLAPMVSRKYGKRNSAFGLAVIAVLVAVSPFVLRFAGVFVENGSVFLLPTLFCLQAVFATCGIASATLVHAMIGDVIDQSSLKTGRSAEGLFYAANSFMQKCVSGLGVLVAGLLISFVGLPQGVKPGEVDPVVIMNLAEVYVPMVVLLYVIGASFLYFYQIDRTSHEDNLEKLRGRETHNT
ncbi:MAG: MFS transporter [Spongiibacteraceae bacterium]|nr:MFS transporter [Spongiibacteraceae bacterium]